MAHLHYRTHATPIVTFDPGDMHITLHAHPVHLELDVPEAARVHAELGARLAQARNVNGAPAEVDR